MPAFIVVKSVQKQFSNNREINFKQFLALSAAKVVQKTEFSTLLLLFFAVVLKNKFFCAFNYCVAALVPVLACYVNLNVWLNAELCVAVLCIQRRACRQAHSPSVWQCAVERHSAAAAGLVANDGNMRQVAHNQYKMVGGAIYAPVGEHHHRAQPSCSFAGLKVQRSGRGKVIVPLAGLVLYVSVMYLLLYEY